jgi:hypothetical protein
MEGSILRHDPFLSRPSGSELYGSEKGSQAAGWDGARVVAGTRRRGGRTIQSWVKPEVDPPMGVARCRTGVFHGRDDRAPLFCAARGSCKWEVTPSRNAIFNHELIEFSVSVAPSTTYRR